MNESMGLLVTIEGYQTLAIVRECLLEFLKVQVLEVNLHLFQESLKDRRLLP